MKVFLILIWVGAALACGQNAATNQAANQLLKASPTANNSTASNAASNNAAAASPDKQAVRTFDGKGVVTKINLEIVSVELKHEEIKGLMPAMQMEFHVTEKSQLEKLKVGDQVDFVLEDNQGAEQITSIKKAK